MSLSFDPELHLRLAGEAALLATRNGPTRVEPLIESARALVALDLLKVELAQGIVADYGLALRMRAGEHFIEPDPLSARPSPAIPLPPPRVVACDTRIEDDKGAIQVHYVALGDDATALAVTVTISDPGTRRPAMSRGQVLLADDCGNSIPAYLSGGGGAGSLQGQFTTRQPLDPRAHWIELDGHRIELHDRPRTALAHCEPLPAAEPGPRYLWRRLAAAIRGPGTWPSPTQLDAAVAILVAAGALEPDAEVVDEVHRVADSLRLGASPTPLPEPWGSLLLGWNSHRRDGPTGGVAVALTTPPVDGIAILVEGLVSGPEGWRAYVVTSPDSNWDGPASQQSVTLAPLIWWAADNLGHSYLGRAGGWSFGVAMGGGPIEFSPALDPRATELRLLPTGASERAVVIVPLPAWA